MNLKIFALAATVPLSAIAQDADVQHGIQDISDLDGKTITFVDDHIMGFVDIAGIPKNVVADGMFETDQSINASAAVARWFTSALDSDFQVDPDSHHTHLAGCFARALSVQSALKKSLEPKFDLDQRSSTLCTSEDGDLALNLQCSTRQIRYVTNPNTKNFSITTYTDLPVCDVSVAYDFRDFN